MREVMREIVRQHWGLIEQMGYEYDSLDSQYNLVLDYRSIMAD